VSINDAYEEVVAYNDIVDYIEQDDRKDPEVQGDSRPQASWHLPTRYWYVGYNLKAFFGNRRNYLGTVIT
jgi:hypothetical protein